MRKTIKEFTFFCSLFFLILKEYWVLFFFGYDAPLLNEIIILSGLLLGISLVLTRLKKIEIIVLSLAFISYLLKQNVTFPLLTLAIITSKKITLSKIIHFHLIVSGILFFTVLISSLFNIMPSTKLIDIRNVDGYDEIRYNLGFGGANGAFLYFFPIFLSTIYLLRNKYLKLLIFPFLILCIIVINKYTLSRTGFYSSLFTFVLIIILPRLNLQKRKLLSFLLKNIIIIFVLLSIATAIFLNTPKFNSILAYRPSYWALHLIQTVYSYNLWGYPWDQTIQTLITKYPLDNSFISMILAKGLIFSIIIYFVYYKGISVLLQQNLHIELAITLATLIFSFFENTLFVIGLNISFFILYNSITNTKNNSSNEPTYHNSQKDTLLLVK